jgi:hypothetical protein
MSLMHRRLEEHRRQWRHRHQHNNMDPRDQHEHEHEHEHDHEHDNPDNDNDNVDPLRLRDDAWILLQDEGWMAQRRRRRSYGRSSFQNFMAREQAEYQNNMGCSYWNQNNHCLATMGSNTLNGVHVHGSGPAQPELLLLKRVKACIGWAVHGLVLEFVDGTRAGFVVDVSSIQDEDAIERRRCTEWVDVTLGDYVTAVHGYHLSRGCFLCHTVHLELASGRTISFASKHEPWKGAPFRYTLPENALLHYVSFREGKCMGVTAAETILHLPVQSTHRVLSLSKVHQDTFQLLQLIAHRIDDTRAEQGGRPLGRDLWRTIFCEYLACNDLQDYGSSAVGRLIIERQRRPSYDSTV